MKYYIRQKVFTFRDRFSIKNAAGEDIYQAVGELISWGRKIHVYDMAQNGSEVALIAQKVFAWLHTYRIQLPNATLTLKKDFTFFKPRFHIEEIPYEIYGDIWAHNYELRLQSRTVMRIQKGWFTWGDSYEIDIDPSANELLCLCIVIALDSAEADHARHQKNNS